MSSNVLGAVSGHNLQSSTTNRVHDDVPGDIELSPRVWNDAAGEETAIVGPELVPITEGFVTSQRSFGFWMIIIGLGVTLLLCALENTVITTAGPSILADFDMGGNWIWVTNAFFLSSAAFQPLNGQLANVFGRRWPTLCVVATFMLGSGICGGATSGGMLIAGRAIQGIGSGGILQAYDTIVSDLVPLRDRGNYIAVVLLIYSIGTTLGPVIGGGLIDVGSWRWCFYINLPVGGVSLIMLFSFLHVRSRRDSDWFTRLVRGVDLIGNLLIVAGTTIMLVALSYAGNPYPWGSWHTLVPLVIGLALLGVLGAWESLSLWASRYSWSTPLVKWAPPEPVMPPRLFASATSVIIAINTFLYTAVTYWGVFFLPVYFQTVKLASPLAAGVDVLPLSLLAVPTAAAAAFTLSYVGRYKAIHLIGFAIYTVGCGLLTLLTEESPKSAWVCYELLCAAGAGMLLNSQLPAFQAPIEEVDQAVATGTWNFVRTLGSVWGIAIPAAIFASRVDNLVAAGAISSDPIAAALLTGGGAYEHGSASFIKSFADPAAQAQIRHVYMLACQRVYQAGIPFLGVAFLLGLFEKDIKLRTVLETDFGLDDRKEKA
ncbi:hypothetical protein SLS53_007158 [Cytospora paraplurivora]|uniref:Major facilitator superfamily (MFS) profile domain-containing protein n=1 Tax=Cytospora paraplurivora TaxID=2898453 RepID=A0AAN9U0L8_9PEZI